MINVHLHGDFLQSTGLGNAARRSLVALMTSGLDVQPVELSQAASEPITHQAILSRIFRKTILLSNRSSPEDGDNVNLIHTNPDRILELIKNKEALLHNIICNRHPFIGYWAWEVANNIPAFWEPLLDRVTEIWVPSRFVANAIAPFVPCPVISMPHPISHMPFKHIDFIHRLGRDGHYFLSLFDGLSGFSRKNPIGLIRAWKTTFPRPTRHSTLIIKTKNVSEHCMHLLSSLVSRRDDIIVLNQDIESTLLNSLIAGARALISLHRAEGFGLSLAEAMMMGVPVIATNYSGNLEFMNSDNSLLVNFKETALQADDGYYPKGSVWAEPDQEHAASLISMLDNDKNLAYNIGKRGQASVSRSLSTITLGEKMAKRITLLRKLRRV